MLPLSLLVACTCRSDPPEPPPPHYEGAVELRLAVEEGDLPALHRAARELEGDQEETGKLDGALGYAQVVEDLDEAAFAAAEVAEACGACHRAARVDLGTTLRLDGHAQVAESLWDATVVGDQQAVATAAAAWDQGELGDAPLEQALASCAGCHPKP